MPAPAKTPTTEELRDALIETTELLGAFRSKLRSACFPFPEPPGVDRIISGNDALCFPETPRVRKNSKAATAQP